MPSIPKTYEKLIEFFQNKKFEEAKIEAKKILARYADDEFVLRVLGACYVYLQDYLLAVEVFNQLSRLNPTNIEYIIAYANALLKINKEREALLVLENASKIDPNNTEILRILTRIYLDNRKLDLAEKSINTAINIEPNNSDNRLSYGVFLIRCDRLREAQLQLSKAIQLDDTNLLAKYNLGLAYKKQRNLSAAKEQHFAVLQQKNDFYHSLRELSDIFELLGDFERALEFGKEAYNLDRTNSDIQFQLAKLFYKTGKWCDALEAFKKVKTPHNQRTLSQVFIDILGPSAASISEIEKNSPLVNGTVTFKLPYSKQLTNYLYSQHKIALSKTSDPSFGNSTGSNYDALEDPNPQTARMRRALIGAIERVFERKIHIIDSFFTIFRAGGGTRPHDHITDFDHSFGSELIDRKFSLVFYLKVGDQSSDEPGILKLYEPDFDYLPEEATCIIFKGNRPHSSLYSGTKDRVIIGLNFYVT